MSETKAEYVLHDFAAMAERPSEAIVIWATNLCKDRGWDCVNAMVLRADIGIAYATACIAKCQVCGTVRVWVDDEVQTHPALR